MDKWSIAGNISNKHKNKKEEKEQPLRQMQQSEISETGKCITQRN